MKGGLVVGGKISGGVGGGGARQVVTPGGRGGSRYIGGVAGGRPRCRRREPRCGAGVAVCVGRRLPPHGQRPAHPLGQPDPAWPVNSITRAGRATARPDPGAEDAPTPQPVRRPAGMAARVRVADGRPSRCGLAQRLSGAAGPSRAGPAWERSRRRSNWMHCAIGDSA